MSDRIQKILASHGLGSRREIERWIAEGRIALNGVTAKLGDRFTLGDRVVVDGRDITARLKAFTPIQVLMYHKPQGQALVRNESRLEVNATSDNVAGVESDEMPADHNELVHDRLPALRGSRWIPINPMHPGDSGLLLVTNDGNLDYALTRRKRWIPTAYMVRVLAPGSASAPPEIPLQVTYDDNVVEFTQVEPAGGEGANLWYRVELDRADRRAAVRALFESREMKVSRMTQVMFGGIELPRDLPRMRHRELNPDQVARLYEFARISKPEPPTPEVLKALEAAAKPRPVRGERARSGKLRGPAPDRRKPKRRKSF